MYIKKVSNQNDYNFVLFRKHCCNELSNDKLKATLVIRFDRRHHKNDPFSFKQFPLCVA